MGPFEGFHRRAVVLVPSEDEYTKRKEKKVQDGGRKITYDSMMKWKAAMTLPQDDSGLFEKIDFLDLDREEAEKLVASYNVEGEAYKKKMEEKYGSADKDKRDKNRKLYSNPPPVVYSNGAAPGQPGSGAANDNNATAWQEYYKKYYEYYGQYPQGMPPPVVSQGYTAGSNSGSGSSSDTAQQWAQYQQQYQQYYQQYQQYYQQQMQK